MMKIKLYSENNVIQAKVQDIDAFLAISGFMLSNLAPKLCKSPDCGSLSLVLDINLTTDKELRFSLNYVKDNKIIEKLGSVGIELNQNADLSCMLVSDRI